MLSGRRLLELVEDVTWRGLPYWRCALCGFGSLRSKDAVIEHVLRVHPDAGEEPRRAAPGIVDTTEETENNHD